MTSWHLDEENAKAEDVHLRVLQARVVSLVGTPFIESDRFSGGHQFCRDDHLPFECGSSHSSVIGAHEKKKKARQRPGKFCRKQS